MLKICSKCKKEKTLDKFWKNKASKDGLQSVCAECKMDYHWKNKEKAKKYYREYNKNPERKSRNQDLHKAYMLIPGNVENAIIRSKKCAEKYPEKVVARSALRSAIRYGKLTRKPCAVCGTEKNIHGHHKDYSKPLDVVWLCLKHHAKTHSSQRRDDHVKLATKRTSRKIP